MPRKKLSQTVYLTSVQDLALRNLRDRTGIPVAVLIRDAIDVALTRWMDDTEKVFAEAETALEAERAQAAEENRYSLAVYEDLDMVLSHARQVQLERDKARLLTQHYRARIRGAQDALSQALADADVLHEP